MDDMKRLAAMVMLALATGQLAFADDEDAARKNGKGSTLSNVEKGLQSAGQGIAKGARESGIESGVRAAGTGVKNAAKSIGNSSHKSDKPAADKK
jgi:hypothetical protein